MSELSHLNIGTLKSKFDLQDFVETGCYLGNGIQCATDNNFTNIHSCDINQIYVTDCKTKFTHANIIHSESLAFLKELLPTLNNRTLFWLDAHFPDYYGTNDKTEEFRIPLITEMELIKQLKPDYSKDVFICDDMRTFRSPLNSRYIEGEIEERFYIDVDWNYFTGIFTNTHEYELINALDGVMIFHPKDYKDQK